MTPLVIASFPKAQTFFWSSFSSSVLIIRTSVTPSWSQIITLKAGIERTLHNPKYGPIQTHTSSFLALRPDAKPDRIVSMIIQDAGIHYFQKRDVNIYNLEGKIRQEEKSRDQKRERETHQEKQPDSQYAQHTSQTCTH